MKITVIKENKIAFAKTKPTSAPILYFMNIMATNPATVVRLLARTGTKDVFQALVRASFRERFCFR